MRKEHRQCHIDLPITIDRDGVETHDVRKRYGDAFWAYSQYVNNAKHDKGRTFSVQVA